jgi:ketosteroid isomerase-like protein
MNLSKVVASLVEAQNNHDSIAYVNCFSETAVVFDEGKTHRGKREIQQWIEHSDQQYRTVLKPMSYEENVSGNILQAEASGNFPGSPAVLHFHFDLQNGLINSLKITG